MNQKILFIELKTKKSFPKESTLRIITKGYQIIIEDEINHAISRIKNESDISVMVVNDAVEDVFLAFRQKFPKGTSILVTAGTMDEYAASLSFREEQLVDHVIANSGPADWVVGELRSTIQKLCTTDIFGLDKYLLPGTNLHSRTVKDSMCRNMLNNEVAEFAEFHKLGSHIAKLAYGISEELLMNAIYDAPVDAYGKSIYAGVHRSNKVSLKPSEYAQLTYGCDGQTLAISVCDPFGSLKKEKFHNYIKKVVRRHEGINIIDHKKGGAGLGLFKILYSCHALICNSMPNQKTEVISLINVHQQIRDFSKMARSLHYFVANSV